MNPIAKFKKWWGSWSWRGGASFSGPKFNGAMSYPSKWNLDFSALRAQSKKAYFESMQARGILSRLVDNAISYGLALEANPIWDLLDPTGRIDNEGRVKWIREVENRFTLWAHSRDADATERKTFQQLQEFAFLNRLRDGEIFAILKYSGDTRKQNPLEIQFIDPDQVADPYDGAYGKAAEARGNKITDGIEVTSAGKEIAYYIQDGDSMEWTRIPKYGNNSGRLFLIHAARADIIGQVRGTPYLSHIIHEIEKLTDYQVAEIEAAVVNAIIAAWIKPSPDAPASRALQGVMARRDSVDASTAVGGPKEGDALKPGLYVQTLKAGEELVSYDTKRPNVNFDAFKKSFEQSLAQSMSIPVEILNMSFNANYSASRAAILLFWYVVEKMQADFAADFLNPIYEMWLTEEIKAGRIKAEGWDTPVMRRAWLNCDWTGIPQPSIDPLKEANAATVRISDGLTTREREAKRYNGSEFRENVERLTVENTELAAANKSMAKPVPGAEPEPEEREEDDEGDRDQGGGARDRATIHLPRIKLPEVNITLAKPAMTRKVKINRDENGVMRSAEIEER